jgi:serine/threonine protein kinase
MNVHAHRGLARGSSLGRYLLLDRLGEGGMGVVYKAYDPELDRPIALKLLHTGEDASSADHDRLVREAQALARLSHPNVVAVHDVGSFGSAVFIAMEFVEGQTVRAWLKSGTRSHREIVDVFLAAGEGLAAAHRAGLVHRDFKPDNVIVGDDGRVRVLDFGLARAANSSVTENANVNANAAPKGRADGAAGGLERVPEQAPQSGAQLGSSQGSKSMPANANVDATVPGRSSSRTSSSALTPSESGRLTPNLLATPLTHAGDTVGTPRFMAPEQHLGDSFDEAADQFSFCVSLHWALYGSFPFQGERESDWYANLIAGRVADAPADASVPRWLRAVILRGLSVKTSHRFPSMTALLDALKADPRIARRRWLRAAGSVVAVTAVVCAAVAGGLALKARRDAGEQARLAQRFGQEVERIAAISRYGASQPLHDTRRERNAISARMDRLKARMRALGPIASAPGHEALGRGYLALERYDEALTELDAAWATGYRTAELAYALGMVHGKLYQRALAQLHKTNDPQLDAERRARVVREHRDPALRYLKELKAHDGDAQESIGADAPEYVEGLIALYEMRFDDALALAQRAAEGALWPYDARTLVGDIHFMAGREAEWKGDIDGALAELGRAGEAYRAAIDAARSGRAAYYGECGRLVEVAQIQQDRSQSPEPTVKQVISACSQAAALRPDDPSPLLEQAQGWRLIASYDESHGIDNSSAVEEAIRLAERALVLDPRQKQAHQVIALSRMSIAEARIYKGFDARETLAQVIDHTRQVLSLDPQAVEAFVLTCIAYNRQGIAEESLGHDPRPFWQRAIEQGEQALRIAPRNFRAWNNIGMNWVSIGQWEMTHGLSPKEAFTRAEAAFQEVTRISPMLDYGPINLCAVYQPWADYERRHGVDPSARVKQATDSCRQAVKLSDNFADAHYYLGLSQSVLAEWQLEQGNDPTGLLAQARGEFERAHQIDASDPSNLSQLGELSLLEARWLAGRGHDPRPSFERADAFARQAIAHHQGKATDDLRLQAELRQRRAEWRLGHGESPAGDLRDGLSLVARARADAPDSASLLAVEGALHLLEARAARAPAARKEAAGLARDALEKALGIDGNLERECRPQVAEAARLAD